LIKEIFKTIFYSLSPSSAVKSEPESDTERKNIVLELDREAFNSLAEVIKTTDIDTIPEITFTNNPLKFFGHTVKGWEKADLTIRRKR
jgi:hypothetical protein